MDDAQRRPAGERYFAGRDRTLDADSQPTLDAALIRTLDADSQPTPDAHSRATLDADSQRTRDADSQRTLHAGLQRILCAASLRAALGIRRWLQSFRLWKLRLTCVCASALAICACGVDRPMPRAERAPPAPASPTPAAKATPSASPASAPDVMQPAAPEPSTLASRRLDRAALERLVEDARATSSDELVIIKDGELVGHWFFTNKRGPIQTMSITKTVLSLAVGTLVDQGKLRLEQPVHTLYPEWQTGKKRDITLLHLLSHTSGLDEGNGPREIYAHKSFVDFTLQTQLIHDPGTHYKYSNRGANLVSGIVGKASGMRTDRYVEKVLFEPLCIRNYAWARDGAGQPRGLAGLHLLPRDLAKLGELVLADGSWNGRTLVSKEWLRRSMVPGSVQPSNKRLGLFWWLIPEWTRVTIDGAIVAGFRKVGADEAFIAKIEPLIGRRFDSVVSFVAALRELFDDPKLSEWNENTWKRGVPDAHFEFGPIVGAYSAGTLGQYLVILPRDRLVAVRMRRSPKNPAERDDERRTFPDFVERVQGLIHGSQSTSRRSGPSTPFASSESTRPR